MSGLGELSCGTRVPIFPGSFCVPGTRTEVYGTSVTGTKISQECPVLSLAYLWSATKWIKSKL